MNSPPYGYGGRTAETTVFAVRIIMSPTCSKRDFAGRNALSAIDLTIALLRGRPKLRRGPARPNAAQKKEYLMKPPFATHNRHARSHRKKAPELAIQEPVRGGYRAWYVARAFG